MTKEQAIYTFFSRFLPSYEETSVPDEATLPYLTYQGVSGDVQSGMIPMAVSLWYMDTGWAGINAKAEEISKALGLNGKIIPCDGGGIWIVKGTPFRQSMGDTDERIRRKYLNLNVEFLTDY